MTGQQLKNSILQMAVQGKLVPQDPNDEPASVLLERIRKEKEQLIKDGKIKKEKNPSIIFRGADNLPYEKVGNNDPVCIADKVPFDIPDSWEWVRLGNYAEKVTDQVASGSFAALRANVPSLKEPDYAIMVKTADFSNGFTRNLTYTTEHGYNFLENSNLFGGELILSNIGSIGKCFIVPKLEQKMTLAPNSVMIRLTDEDLRDYLYNFITSPQGYSELIAIASGTAMKKFNKTDLKTIFIPVPPIAEQKRIVNKLNELQPYIDNYTAKEIRISKLNLNFHDDLKKSILQEAVQGKLVPQDPNDEPASVLLERIRDEKQALIKAGKIKKDKNESVIFRRDNSHYEKLNGIERCIDDEIPFDIPDNWCWVRLGTLFQHNTGKALNSSNKIGTKLTYITTSNLYWDKFVLDRLKEMPFTDAEVEKCTVIKGDLLVCEGGDIGRAAIWNYDFPMRIQNHIHRLRSYIPVNVKFYYYIFYLYKHMGLIGGKGIGIQGLSSKVLHQLLFPFPPLQEQYRIVEMIDKVPLYCEEI